MMEHRPNHPLWACRVVAELDIPAGLQEKRDRIDRLHREAFKLMNAWQPGAVEQLADRGYGSSLYLPLGDEHGLPVLIDGMLESLANVAGKSSAQRYRQLGLGVVVINSVSQELPVYGGVELVWFGQDVGGELCGIGINPEMSQGKVFVYAPRENTCVLDSDYGARVRSLKNETLYWRGVASFTQQCVLINSLTQRLTLRNHQRARGVDAVDGLGVSEFVGSVFVRYLGK